MHNTTVTEHNFRNSCKGTIIYSNKLEYSEIELCEELKKFSGTKEKIKRNDDNVRRTELYILTFDYFNIHENVKIGWTKLKVQDTFPTQSAAFNASDGGMELLRVEQ